MLRALLGLILIVMSAMLTNALGPVYWAIASAIGAGLIYWGIDSYVQKQINPD